MTAQSPHNTNWILGNNNWGPIGTILTFDQDTFSLDTIEVQLGIDAANISFSDENGELLFYANGCTIFNTDFDTMDQAGQMNPGLEVDFFCNVFGGSESQGQIVIPSSKQPDQYFYFHIFDHQIFDDPNGGITAYLPTKFGYSLIDMQANNGLGRVIEKNTVVFQDTLAHTGFQAIRHANGQDWWIILGKARSNKYFRFLFENDHLSSYPYQSLGSSWPFYDRGQSVVSLDGEKFIRYCANIGISIFDFDRCHGHFTDHQFIDFPNPKKLLGGIAISPNKRFLYVSNRNEIFQLDLNANDIPESAILIDSYNGISNPGSSDFMLSANGNDGKIYWCSWSSKNLHVINLPNEEGSACNFVQQAIELPSVVNIGLPNIIHYELGVDPEYCDFSPTTEVEKDLDIKIFPNPNTGIFYLENIPFGSSIRMVNSLGQIVYQEDSTNDNLSIRISKVGIYFLTVTHQEAIIFTDKVIIRTF